MRCNARNTRVPSIFLPSGYECDAGAPLCLSILACVRLVRGSGTSPANVETRLVEAQQTKEKPLQIKILLNPNARDHVVDTSYEAAFGAYWC